MKKIIAIALVLLLLISFGACAKNNNVPDVELHEGEMMLRGKITKVSGSLIILESGDSSISNKFSFGYSDSITVVENGAFVVDYSADAFKGKTVSIICSELVQETYPAGLMDVRMIIIS